MKWNKVVDEDFELRFILHDACMLAFGFTAQVKLVSAAENPFIWNITKRKRFLYNCVYKNLAKEKTLWRKSWVVKTGHIKVKGQVIRATFACNLSRNKYCVASYDFLLRVLPPPCATNFHVAESTLRFVFLLQHENLLRAEVVILATNNRNLQRDICCGTICKKTLPVVFGLLVQLYF